MSTSNPLHFLWKFKKQSLSLPSKQMTFLLVLMLWQSPPTLAKRLVTFVTHSCGLQMIFSSCSVIEGVKKLISGNLSLEKVKMVYINKITYWILPTCSADHAIAWMSSKCNVSVSRYKFNGAVRTPPSIIYRKPVLRQPCPAPESILTVERTYVYREFKYFMSNTHWWYID